MPYNQFALHQEKETYRLVVTTGASTTHPVLGIYATKGCIPAITTDATKNPGTITTVSTGGQDGKIVFGTGTLFTTYYQVGDYIADSNFVLRKITEVNSDTVMHLEAKFPSDLTGATPNRIKPLYCSVEAKNTGSAAAILQEQTFISVDTFVNGGAPISYDVSGANAQISFTLHL